MAQIDKPNLHFNTKLYTGNGSTQSITGVEFQPDWVWIKNRDVNNWHNLTDAVRGNTKILYSNDGGAEGTATNIVTSFDSDGFGLGSNGDVNRNSENYTSWNWKANGAGSSNTNGSITSTVSVNTTAGFSIVKYTGTGSNATVGHGLGSTPKMIIAKQYSSNGGTEHWTVFHNSLDTNKNLYLNLTNAEDTPSPEIYREGSFTNDVFAIGAHDRINNNTVSYIAYCFAEKKGFSKFGSYTGNGNANGAFVYCGFKPAWIMIKCSSHSGDGWHIRDTKRSPINVVDDSLYANSSNAEVTNNTALTTDFLSNGFKLRNTDTNDNTDGRTYIYMAFAEEPLVGSNNIPATAR